MNKDIVIAIDGHSSCGKSTMAKALAKKLHYLYIDSGAMYRAVTLYCLQNDIDPKDAPAIEKALSYIHIDFRQENGQNITHLNDENVEREIRTMQVSENVSEVSKIGAVRTHLVKLQQDLGRKKGIVMDGRDIGTVVFPSAELKIFMTASPEIRAQRRLDELLEKGEKTDFDTVLQNLHKRDEIDSNREIAPLRKAEDAKVLDNSNLNRKQQLEIALDWAKAS
ncbi:MAG: (d)CMP kinase [Chitinophagales bacterium]